MTRTTRPKKTAAKAPPPRDGVARAGAHAPAANCSPVHGVEGRIPTIRRVTTPLDSNLMGTVFGGAILSEIDLAAAIEAHRLHPGNVVTVAMEKVEFKRPIFVGDLVSLYTEPVRTGRTSVTVRVCVWADRRLPPFQSVQVTEALVTMVAVDAEMRPVPLSAKSLPS